MNTPAPPPDHDPPERDVLAGEYVLGVLDASGRSRVERLIADDATFAGEIISWENRLMPLVAEIAPVPVPDHVWTRISNALGFVPAVRRPVEPPPRPALRDSLALWRWLTVGGFAIAGVCAFALFTALRLPAPIPPPPPPIATGPAPSATPSSMMVSTLARDDGQPGYVATVDASSGHISITPLKPTTEAGRVQELWFIPADGKPRSLGLVSAEWPQSSWVPAELLPQLDAKAVFAITLEPPGGSPGGKPSGPVTEKGQISQLL